MMTWTSSTARRSSPVRGACTSACASAARNCPTRAPRRSSSSRSRSRRTLTCARASKRCAGACMHVACLRNPPPSHHMRTRPAAAQPRVIVSHIHIGSQHSAPPRPCFPCATAPHNDDVNTMTTTATTGGLWRYRPCLAEPCATAGIKACNWSGSSGIQALPWCVQGRDAWKQPGNGLAS